jgi:hypothetical protein
MTLNQQELRNRFDSILNNEAAIFLETTPYAKHLTDLTEDLDERYYLRHRIETVHRIRLSAKTDALALAKLIESDYGAARAWGRYTIEELNHDVLYLADLKKHGYDEPLVLGTAPFSSTLALIAYLETEIARIGALPAIAYSLFVEWNSERYSAAAVDHAEMKFSSGQVAGSRRHVGIDEKLDHMSEMFTLCYRVINNSQTSTEDLFSITRNISSHFRNYFSELYDTTIAKAVIR